MADTAASAPVPAATIPPASDAHEGGAMDPQSLLVHRLRFLSLVQQVAKADVEQCIDAVGLDALRHRAATVKIPKPSAEIFSVLHRNEGHSVGGGYGRAARYGDGPGASLTRPTASWQRKHGVGGDDSAPEPSSKPKRKPSPKRKKVVPRRRDSDSEAAVHPPDPAYFDEEEAAMIEAHRAKTQHAKRGQTQHGHSHDQYVDPEAAQYATRLGEAPVARGVGGRPQSPGAARKLEKKRPEPISNEALRAVVEAIKTRSPAPQQHNERVTHEMGTEVPSPQHVGSAKRNTATSPLHPPQRSVGVAFGPSRTDKPSSPLRSQHPPFFTPARVADDPPAAATAEKHKSSSKGTKHTSKPKKSDQGTAPVNVHAPPEILQQINLILAEQDRVASRMGADGGSSMSGSEGEGPAGGNTQPPRRQTTNNAASAFSPEDLAALAAELAEDAAATQDQPTDTDALLSEYLQRVQQLDEEQARIASETFPTAGEATASTPTPTPTTTTKAVQRPAASRGGLCDAMVENILRSRNMHHDYVAAQETQWNTSAVSETVFVERYANVLLSEMLDEVCDEVTAVLDEYVDGLVDHELQ